MGLREIQKYPLDELCQALPFLRQLPSSLLPTLDTSTLYAPSGAIARIRAELERQLNHHIMTYRSHPLASNGGLHLCRLLVPASLTPDEIINLQRAEAACVDEGVVLVAYESPLRLRERAE